MSDKRYYRKSTTITISNFYEQYQLKKYRLDPPYQRDLNVWEEDQKSFLMDTIFKNFPIPPIFLEQKIDSNTGVTKYDVIDGKQRLSTIIDFINNKIALPQEFGKDAYGNNKLNGKYFDEIKNMAQTDEEVRSFLANFWAYSISVEYIENPDVKIVDSIFDRLNREGSRLNSQELRKAQYYDTLLYSDIENYRNDKYLAKLTSKLQKNRMEDIGFITELYIMTVYDSVFDGNENEIDRVFANLAEAYDQAMSIKTKTKFDTIKMILEKWSLDYEKYHIEGVSHLYALWYLAMYVVNNHLPVDEIREKMEKFYMDLRGSNMIPQTIVYRQSMQSASRSKSSRRKRVNAILEYLGYSEKEEQKLI